MRLADSEKNLGGSSETRQATHMDAGDTMLSQTRPSNSRIRVLPLWHTIQSPCRICSILLRIAFSMLSDDRECVTDNYLPLGHVRVDGDPTGTVVDRSSVRRHLVGQSVLQRLQLSIGFGEFLNGQLQGSARLDTSLFARTWRTQNPAQPTLLLSEECDISSQSDDSRGVPIHHGGFVFHDSRLADRNRSTR